MSGDLDNRSELACDDDMLPLPLQGTVEQWDQQRGIGTIAYKRRGPDGIGRDEWLTVHRSSLLDQANVLEEGRTVYFDVWTTKRQGQVVPAAVNVAGPGAVFSPEKAAEVDDVRRRGRSGFSDAASRERDYDRQPQQPQQHQPPHDDCWQSGGSAEPNRSERACDDDMFTLPLQGTVEQWDQQRGIGTIAYKCRCPHGIGRDERLRLHHRATVLEEGCEVYFDVWTAKRQGQVVPAAVNVFFPEKAAEGDDVRRRGRSGFSDAASRERDYDRQQPQQPHGMEWGRN